MTTTFSRLLDDALKVCLTLWAHALTVATIYYDRHTDPSTICESQEVFEIRESLLRTGEYVLACTEMTGPVHSHYTELWFSCHHIHDAMEITSVRDNDLTLLSRMTQNPLIIDWTIDHELYKAIKTCDTKKIREYNRKIVQ